MFAGSLAQKATPAIVQADIQAALSQQTCSFSTGEKAVLRGTGQEAIPSSVRAVTVQSGKILRISVYLWAKDLSLKT